MVFNLDYMHYIKYVYTVDAYNLSISKKNYIDAYHSIKIVFLLVINIFYIYSYTSTQTYRPIIIMFPVLSKKCKEFSETTSIHGLNEVSGASNTFKR